MASREKDESRALKPASGLMRLLTWNLWGPGPRFDARLRLAIKTIADIRPTIFLAQGLPQDGAELLKNAPSWNRLGMREIESPYLSSGPHSSLYASSDAEVNPLNPADYASLDSDSLLLQVAVPGESTVVVAVRILAHTQEPGPRLQNVGAHGGVGGMLSWVSDTDRAILITSLRSAALEQFYDNAMHNCARHLDAWSASRPGESGYTYDGIANACANPGAQKTPDRVCLNASIRSSLKTVHI